MIIVLKKDRQEVLKTVRERLMAGGFHFNVLEGVNYTVVPVVGDLTTSDIGRFRSIEGVDKVLRISSPYYMVTKEYRKKSIVDLGDGIRIGEGFRFIAGPCSVESEESLDRIAAHLSAEGIKLLRGGTYKMRSSPYSFQGLGNEGLAILSRVAKRHGMKTVSEIIDLRSLDYFVEHVDILQIGARSMYNFALLREAAKSGKPILLKRSPAAKIEDFLLSAEHIMLEGNEKLILCERGTLSFDDTSRNAVNIASIPILKDISHLPVILDPSHGVGVARYIPPVCEAALLLGADGVMVETHFDPSNALSDGFQSIDLAQMTRIKKRIANLQRCLEE